MKYSGTFSTATIQGAEYCDTSKRRLYSALLAIARCYLHSPTDRARIVIRDGSGTIKSAYVYQTYTVLT